MSHNASANVMTRYSVCHLEIPAPNLHASIRFYSDVFGWKVTEAEGMDYAFFDDGGIGGGFDPTMQPRDNGVNLVITVDSIEDMLEKISEAGGRVTKGRTAIGGGHGYFAEFLDVQGNRLGIWSRD